MLKKVIMKSHSEKLPVPKQRKMNRTHSTETLTDKSEMKESSTRKGKRRHLENVVK